VQNKKEKKQKVDRKFLMGLANAIYNARTRQFLRLCDGQLQSSPDPTNVERIMHCGLGELYFAMTGLQPEEMSVKEYDVINLAVERSAFNTTAKQRKAKRARARATIKALGLSGDLQASLLDKIDSADEKKFNGNEFKFRKVLDNITSANDDDCGNTCSLEDFRKRSQRVAAGLRAAAKLLPE
jgi:hypothetical protein